MAIIKQLGKFYCWRELMLSTKAMHCCVPVRSSFALILCDTKGEKKMDVKHSYIFVSLFAYFNICFLLMQDFHLRGRQFARTAYGQLSLWVYLCIHFNKLVLEI